MKNIRERVGSAWVGLPLILAVGCGASMPMTAAAPITPMDPGWQTTERPRPLPRLRVHPTVALPGEAVSRPQGPRFAQGRAAAATPRLPQDRGWYAEGVESTAAPAEAPLDVAANVLP
jgi:hypothetical protein